MSQGLPLQCLHVFGQSGAREKILTAGDAFPPRLMVAAFVLAGPFSVPAVAAGQPPKEGRVVSWGCS